MNHFNCPLHSSQIWLATMQETTFDNSHGGRGEQEVIWAANQTAIFAPQQEQTAAP